MEDALTVFGLGSCMALVRSTFMQARYVSPSWECVANVEVRRPLGGIGNEKSIANIAFKDPLSGLLILLCNIAQIPFS